MKYGWKSKETKDGTTYWQKDWPTKLGPKRAAGTNPRAKGTNPRAKGTNPKAQP